MLLAQAVEAGIAFHALVTIHHGALDIRIDVDCSHRTHIGAITASDAFLRIDIHSSLIPQRSAAWRRFGRTTRRRSHKSPMQTRTERSSHSSGPNRPA